MFVAPSFHPAFILRRNRKYYGVVLRDLQRAKKLTEGWRPTWHDQNYVIKPTAECVEVYVENVIKNNRFFELDLETDGRHPFVCDVRCIGLFDGEYGICIPLLYRDGTFSEVQEPGKKKPKKVANWLEFYSTKDRQRVLKALAKLLKWADVEFHAPIDQIRIGGQNLQFDSLCLLKRLGLKVPRRYADLMVAHHIVASMHPHNLGFIASVNTDVNYYKSTDEGEAWSTQSDLDLWIYCIRDCKAQWLSWQALRENVKRRKQDLILYDFDLRLTNECEDWKNNGLLVDPDALALYREYYTTKAERALAAIKKCVAEIFVGKTKSFSDEALQELGRLIDESDSDTFKPGSLPQLRNACSALGIPLTHETDTGQLSTSKEYLLEARGAMLEKGVKARDPRIAFLDYLFAWREASKIESTYLRPEIQPDGRVHGSFHVGPPTGRLASSEPNIQNQPSEIRGMYIARAGHVLVSIDWSAGELRLAGFIFNEDFLINAFKAFDAGTGPKIHKVNAAMIFKVPMERLTEPLYRAGKVFAYAVCYGATEMTVYEQCRKEMPDLTFEAFKICYANFKAGLPKLFAGQKDLVALGIKKHYLDSPIMERREYFLERPSWTGSSIEESAMLNFPEQSGLADVVINADFRIADLVLPKYRARLRPGEVLLQLAQVHDELLYEVPERFAKEFEAEIVKVANMPTAQKPDWNMPVEPKTSRRWKPIPLEVFLAVGAIPPSLHGDAKYAAKGKLEELTADIKKAKDDAKKLERLTKQRDAINAMLRRLKA